MPTGNELKKSALSKLESAKILCNKRQYDDAYYFAGYVVEFALKAVICKKKNFRYYPEKGKIAKDYKKHIYSDLIELAELTEILRDELKEKSGFFINWSLVTTWSVNLRYTPIGTSSEQKTKDFIDALEDPEEGVLTWLMKHW